MFYFLSLSAALFAIGVFGLLSRKELVGKLVSIILMFNPVVIMFATFNHFVLNTGTVGIVFVSFIMLSVVSLVLIGSYLIYKQYSTHPSSDKTTLNLFD